MRRLDSDARIAWIRLSRKRENRRINRKKRIADPQKTKRLSDSLKQKNNSSTYTLKAPEIFGLRDSKNRKTLIAFIEIFRNQVLIQKKRVRIDFTDTQQMVVCGTLFFFSELHRIERELGSLELLSCTPPKNERAAQVLQHLGIFKKLNNKCSITPEADNVINWKFASGEIADATQVGKILESQSKS